jgi:hypothetical protein
MVKPKINVGTTSRRNHMANINDREFVEKTARLVFAALVGRDKTEAAGDKTGLLRGYAAAAWQAADILLEQQREHNIGKYAAVLQNHEGAEAVRRILDLGGYKGRALEYFTDRYADKSDPLKAFAEDNLGPRTAGQEAVSRFLEKRTAE